MHLRPANSGCLLSQGRENMSFPDSHCASCERLETTMRKRGDKRALAHPPPNAFCVIGEKMVSAGCRVWMEAKVEKLSTTDSSTPRPCWMWGRQKNSPTESSKTGTGWIIKQMNGKLITSSPWKTSEEYVFSICLHHLLIFPLEPGPYIKETHITHFTEEEEYLHTWCIVNTACTFTGWYILFYHMYLPPYAFAKSAAHENNMMALDHCASAMCNTQVLNTFPKVRDLFKLNGQFNLLRKVGLIWHCII